MEKKINYDENIKRVEELVNDGAIDQAIIDAQALLDKYSVKKDTLNVESEYDYQMKIIKKLNNPEYANYLRSLSFDEIMLHFMRQGVNCLSSLMMKALRDSLSISMDEYCAQYKNFIENLDLSLLNKKDEDIGKVKRRKEARYKRRNLSQTPN